MTELGNDVINDIYEANYRDHLSSGNTDNDDEFSVATKILVHATSDCDNSVREAWIKAKYIDKKFVCSISDFRGSELSKRFDDIVFSENGWLVQRRRRNKVKLRTEKMPAATDKQSTTDDSASGSELSIDSNRTNNDDLSFGSDIDSTDDDDDNTSDLSEEKLSDFNSDLLLYRATNVHNLPIMCYALASGASKNCINSNDSYRLPLHQAVLSVCIDF